MPKIITAIRYFIGGLGSAIRPEKAIKDAQNKKKASRLYSYTTPLYTLKKS